MNDKAEVVVALPKRRIGIAPPPATAAERAHFMDADNWSVTLWIRFGPHDVCVYRDAPGEWRWRALAHGDHRVRVTAGRAFPNHAAARADAWKHLEPGLNWSVGA